ncbi:MAG: type II toxin-antitoxin system RelE/ParE family toxin [Puniceicoccales bacterium]|jgi:proteic killer suppression protein|nr:type II toxin-antitoxin system RelE/ParE family toxin [Puniceicoccales bacterium]
MIQSFGDKETQKVFSRKYSQKLPPDIQQRAHERLLFVDSAETVESLRIPPSNRLHALSGTRKGSWSISINNQWRITFQWGLRGPENVKIEDYHS